MAHLYGDGGAITIIPAAVMWQMLKRYSETPVASAVWDHFSPQTVLGLGAANSPKLLLNVLFPGHIFLLFHFRGSTVLHGRAMGPTTSALGRKVEEKSPSSNLQRDGAKKRKSILRMFKPKALLPLRDTSSSIKAMEGKKNEALIALMWM